MKRTGLLIIAIFTTYLDAIQQTNNFSDWWNSYQNQQGPLKVYKGCRVMKSEDSTNAFEGLKKRTLQVRWMLIGIKQFDMFALCGFPSEAGDILSMNDYWCMCPKSDLSPWYDSNEDGKLVYHVEPSNRTHLWPVDYTQPGSYPNSSCDEIKTGIVKALQQIGEKATAYQKDTTKLNDLINTLRDYTRRRNLDPLSSLTNILKDVNGYLEKINQNTDFYKSCGQQVIPPPSIAETIGALANSAAGTAASLNLPFALGKKFGIDVDAMFSKGVEVAKNFISGIGGSVSRVTQPPYPCQVTINKPQNENQFIGWQKNYYSCRPFGGALRNVQRTGSMFDFCRVGGDQQKLRDLDAWCVCAPTANQFPFIDFTTS